MVRAVPVAPSAAVIENPRLIIALIAVIDAQKINGTVILKSYDVSFWDVTVKRSSSRKLQNALGLIPRRTLPSSSRGADLKRQRIW